jgi:hypothetical protein
MVHISKNNLSPELRNELERLSKIGDLIGGVDIYDHLPTVNDDFGTGTSIIADVTQIKSHDLVIVSDATSVSKGKNAVFEAATTAEEGAAVTWSFVMNMIVPLPKRVSVLVTDVPTVTGGNPPVLSSEIKSIWSGDPQAVEVFVNGLYESGFSINGDSELILTGYPTNGWTSQDIVEVFVWKPV